MGKKNYIPEGEWVLQEMLKVAMEDEKNDWLKYRRIAKMAKKEKDKEKVYKIADDEKGHLRKVLYVYKRLYGNEKVKLHVTTPKYYAFDIAIGKAIAAEYHGIAFYQEVLGRVPCDELKKIIRAIMADEQNHAVVLDGILSHCQCRGEKKSIETGE